MNTKRKPEFADLASILTAQLRDTVVLGAYVQTVEERFLDEVGAVPDLLKSLCLELRTLSEMINRRAATCGKPTRYSGEEEPLLRRGEDGSLESVLNCFSRYAQRTSERLVGVRRVNDQASIDLFDRILSPTKAGAFFVDLFKFSRAQSPADPSADTEARFGAAHGQLAA